MTTRKHALLAFSALALMGILLPGCGGKSNDETPAATKDAANREGGSDPTSSKAPGSPATPGAASTSTGSLANPQPPEGGAK